MRQRAFATSGKVASEERTPEAAGEPAENTVFAECTYYEPHMVMRYVSDSDYLNDVVQARPTYHKPVPLKGRVLVNGYKKPWPHARGEVSGLPPSPNGKPLKVSEFKFKNLAQGLNWLMDRREDALEKNPKLDAEVSAPAALKPRTSLPACERARVGEPLSFVRTQHGVFPAYDVCFFCGGRLGANAKKVAVKRNADDAPAFADATAETSFASRLSCGQCLPRIPFASVVQK